MSFEQLLQWLLLPILVGVAWIARSVSRLEAIVDTLSKSNTELWKHVNKEAEDISDVRENIAKLQGRLEK